MSLVFVKRKTPSGEIRGRQIGEYLGAKVNPGQLGVNDTIIYIKMMPLNIGTPYLDLLDNARYVKVLKKNRHIGAIAVSCDGYDYLSSVLKNKVFLIPQHHCNYENESRETSERPRIAGFIGQENTFAPFENEIRERLGKIGIVLAVKYGCRNRIDVINFYKMIDIQIIWRVGQADGNPLKNPIKISNAASFGVPTVAYPESNFMQEYGDCFISVNSIQEMVCQVEQLSKEKSLYDFYSVIAKERAKRYHISNIAKIYEGLVA